MRKSSKILWIALAVVAMVFVMTVGAMASVQSTAVVYGVADVNEADTFAVVYKFENNNTDVECGKITLTWDSAKISAVEIVKGADLGDADVESKIEDGKAVIAWAGSDIDAETEEGELFTVNFKKVAFAEGGVAAIDVSVDNFGFVGAFVTYELAGDVVANKTLASSSDNFVWTVEMAENDDSPADFLSAAAQAAKDGADVTVTLEANMVFAGGEYVNENGFDEDAGTVIITSALNGSVPSFGISVPSNKIVFFDGKYSFNDINVSRVPVDGANSATSGGCFQFNNGMGVFGDNGVISNAGGVPHLAGHVEVWDGDYYTISGNYYKSGKTVVEPHIIVGGDVTTEYLIGGSYNDATSQVSGKSYVKITGNAAPKRVSGGSWYANYVHDGGTVEVDGTPTISVVLVAGFVGNANMADNAKYELNISGGTIETVCGHYFADGGEANVNTVINISGGQFNNKIVGGFYANVTYNANTPNKYNKITGITELNIDGIIRGKDGNYATVLGGSYITLPNSVHEAVSTVNVENVVDATNPTVFVVAGSEFTSTSTGSVHSGKLTVTATDVTTKLGNGYTLSTFRMGSTIESASEHSGEIDATVTNCSGDNKVIGGSYLAHAQAIHSGASTLTIKGTTNSFTGGVIGGSMIVKGSVADMPKYGHTGNSKVVINLDTKESTFSNIIYGGSILGAFGAAHDGDSEILIERGTVSSTLYGGSRMDSAAGAQTGPSKVVVDGKDAYVTSVDVYGGTNASAFTNDLTGHAKGAYGHLNNSSVEIINGVLSGRNLYGGSNLGHNSKCIIDGYIVQGVEGKGHKTSIKITSNTPDSNGNVVTANVVAASANFGYGGFQYADAEILSDTPANVVVNKIMAAGSLGSGATLKGNCKVELKQSGLRFKAIAANTAFILSGGIYGNGNLIGDSHLEITGADSEITITAKDNAASMYIAGGSYLTQASNVMTGNSTLILDGTKVNSYVSSTGIPKVIAGGSIGLGTMTGNSTITLKGDTQITWASNDEKYCLTAGCYGMNDLTSSNSAFACGFRQTGNVEFNVSNVSDGALIDMNTYISGYRSNVDGNLTVKISGKPSFTKDFYTLGNGAGYSAITGDQFVYVSGGTFGKVFYCSGNVATNYYGNNGHNFVGGNSYTEISGGTFNGNIFAGGIGGVVGDIVLKFVGEEFTLSPSIAVYSHGYGTSYQPTRRADAREILDLSLVTDLTGDYAYFTKAYSSSATGRLGDTSRRGFTNVYPALAHTHSLTVTLNDSNRVVGRKFLIDADTLNIIYKDSVKYHDGKMNSSTAISKFNGTVAELCEFDKYASSEAAKTINALKTYDAVSDQPFEKLPTDVNTVYVKAGEAKSADLTFEKIELEINHKTLALGDSISFYFGINEYLRNYYEDFYLVVTHTDKLSNKVTEEEIEEKDLNNATYSFSVDILPQYLGDDFSIKLYAKDKVTQEERTSEFTYGAYTYANNKLASRSAADDAFVSLLVNMFAYGDQAQRYQKYAINDLASEKVGFTDEQKNLIKENLEYTNILDSTHGDTIANAQATFTNVTLVLDSKIGIRYKITLAEGVDIESISVNFDIYDGNGNYNRTVKYTNADSIFEVDDNNGVTKYAILLDALGPHELNNKVLATVYVGDTAISNTLCYSGASYTVGKEGRVGDLCKAIMRYSEAAKEYQDAQDNQ